MKNDPYKKVELFFFFKGRSIQKVVLLNTEYLY